MMQPLMTNLPEPEKSSKTFRVGSTPDGGNAVESMPIVRRFQKRKIPNSQ
jgi:hypothetical protein